IAKVYRARCRKRWRRDCPWLLMIAMERAKFAWRDARGLSWRGATWPDWRIGWRGWREILNCARNLGERGANLCARISAWKEWLMRFTRFISDCLARGHDAGISI